jgi:hypothetical protein
MYPGQYSKPWQYCIVGGLQRQKHNSQAFGRDLIIAECGYYQGLDIPEAWYHIPLGITGLKWRINIYEAIGNAVPVYMAQKFGER